MPGQVSCDAAGVRVDGSSIPVAPNGFASVGNQIFSVATCKPHRFVGVSRPPLGYAAADPRMSGATMAGDFARIRSWRANTVRIEVSQNFWVPTARWYDPAYPGRVEEAVRAARAAGLSVILALQTSDRGDPDYPGDIFRSNPQQEMADVNHSLPFWRDLATRFKGDGGVIFELYSEPFYIPHGKKSNWDLWLNGGVVPAGTVYDEPRKSFRAAGMQQLYDEVRKAGANNLVIVGGTHWGYLLDGVPAHRVKGHNIAYAAHPWDWPDKQPATWQQDWAFLAATDPVILSEIGNYNCQSGYMEKVLDKADELKLSWIAWAWQVPGPEDVPVGPRGESYCNTWKLIADWDGTPTWAGNLVKRRLESY